MPVTATDPWAAPDESAQATEYPRMPDLMNRHLFIIPKRVETKEGKPKTPGDAPENYDVVVSDVIILDGRKNDKIPALPHIQTDFWVSGSKVVAELKAHMKMNPAGTPCLGYLEIRGNAYWLIAADPEVNSSPKTAMALEAYKNPQSFAGPDVRTGARQTEEPPF